MFKIAWSAHYLPYLLLLALLWLLALAGQQAQDALLYSRQALAEHQYWRLLSAHLVHSNGYHLLLNSGGLLLVMLLHADYQTRQPLLWQCVFAALLISLLTWLWQPHIAEYVGLSGILHALLCYGALCDSQLRKVGGKLLLIGLIAKVAYEHYQGPDAALGQLINAEVAIFAHLYGLIAGFVLFGWDVVRNTRLFRGKINPS